MRKNSGSGEQSPQILAEKRKQLRQNQRNQTLIMLNNLQTLDHIPVRMRYAYEFYRNTLANGHAFATRYKIDNIMHG